MHTCYKEIHLQSNAVVILHIADQLLEKLTTAFSSECKYPLHEIFLSRPRQIEYYIAIIHYNCCRYIYMPLKCRCVVPRYYMQYYGSHVTGGYHTSSFPDAAIYLCLLKYLLETNETMTIEVTLCVPAMDT